MKHTRAAAILSAMACTVLLTACAHGPYPGVPDFVPEPPPSPAGAKKVAAPRVLYRIDENRYFEDASEAGHFCENGSPIYYVDKAKGIRTYVVKMDGASMGSTFIIDAANDQYLIGPVTRGNTDCSSGGGTCGGARLPYSTDGGRTWKRADALSPSDEMGVGDIYAYAAGNRKLTSSLNLFQVNVAEAKWSYLPNFTFVPRKPPVDTKFHCTENGKE